MTSGVEDVSDFLHFERKLADSVDRPMHQVVTLYELTRARSSNF